MCIRDRHYSWPGNIRELENIIERAVNVAKSSLIAASDLPDFLSLRQEIPREDQSSPEDAYTGDNLYCLLYTSRCV